MASDISNQDSGAKKIDNSIGKSFRGLLLGTRSATCIFLYSFSGGQEKGALLGEIKRSATTLENPASAVAEAVEQLKTKLFYLQTQNEKYYFLNQPNINRILLTKMENIREQDILAVQDEMLKGQIVGIRFKVFPWPTKPKDIPDIEELKLVILKEKDVVFMREILESKGESPRVNRNTIFFLCPSEIEKTSFLESLKRKIAWEQLQTDKTLKLTDEQRREVSNNLKRESDNLKDSLRRYYRLAYAPARDGIKEVDLGIPTYGERNAIDEETYDRLRTQGEILERIAPLVLKEKYLQNRDTVGTTQIHDAMLKTPGERRLASGRVLEESIKEGVKQGLFGIGDEDMSGPHCRFFKEDPVISFAEHEVLIKDSVCISQRTSPADAGAALSGGESGGAKAPQPAAMGPIPPRTMNQLAIRFAVPRGKVSQIMGIMNFLQSRFQSMEVEIRAEEGSMTQEEYLSKIKEALQQLGISIEE